ncbi:MAG: hypothetical protein HFJ79_00685 [Clostridiales bacterium]|nr:hypothetical protein [Clostridiales bacterium]
MNHPSQHAQGLDALLSQDPSAQDYFSHLPGYIQQTLRDSGNIITTEEELRRTAENMMECI